MGIAAKPNGILVATHHQVWKLCEYVHINNPVTKGGDLYLPQIYSQTPNVFLVDVYFIGIYKANFSLKIM